jgi:hypothetical protein
MPAPEDKQATEPFSGFGQDGADEKESDPFVTQSMEHFSNAAAEKPGESGVGALHFPESGSASPASQPGGLR